MQNKFIMTDGQKAVSLTGEEGWTYFSGFPRTTQDEQYARVAAVFRAYNLIANTVANMPFVLYKGKTEFDTSATWENKVQFLPNPTELLRLVTLSLITTNTAYNLRTKDAVGYKTKGLYHAIPLSFVPVLNAMGTDIDYIERQVGSVMERYKYPEDPKLIRLWRFDHTTELLPSKNTEALAIMNAAGQVYYADMWIKHFYQRGGIAPTVIAMKGAVSPEKKDREEESWSDWLRGLGPRFTNRIARVFNAETLTVQQFGSAVTDLKNNEVYKQALENIALGTGIPISRLLANSANYATAQQDDASWYRDDIIPRCNWIAYEYNRQVFEPIGLRLEFQPQTLDPEQEDETERAQAVNQFMAFLNACPSYEIFIGTADTFGYELSDKLITAAEKFYQDKEKKAEEMQAQMQGAGVVLGPDGKPIPVQTQEAEEEEQDGEEKEKKPFAKAIKANEYSAMIALRIPDVIRAEIKARYSFVDEETLNNLHITLVYLGDNRTLDKLDVVRAVGDLGMYQSPIKGTLQGLARFVNGQEKDPLVVTFDSRQMPGLYNTLCGVLDNHGVPYHKEHGFIPHMTLAYIPSDADMPIDTIEPIEINFSEVYYVDGNVWYPTELVGYENKSKWNPSLDQVAVMQEWRAFALRNYNKSKPYSDRFKKADGVLPETVITGILSALAEAKTDEQIKVAFILEAEVKSESDPLLVLAAAMNKYAEVLSVKQLPATT